VISVSIDMPDRVLGFYAALAAGGARVDFIPAFYVAPEIGISRYSLGFGFYI
jgi:hypothetical protein